MKISDNFYTVLVVFAWIAGAVIARGAWFKILAIFFPPYAWYLLVEVFLHHWGLV